MQKRMTVFAILITAIAATSTAAQTTVTTTSLGTTSPNTVPMFSGNGHNIENSAITQTSTGTVEIGPGPYIVSTETFTVIDPTRPSLSFRTLGVAPPPTGATTSNGTKIRLWNSQSATTLDYAIGINVGQLWQTSNGGFGWYVNNSGTPVETMVIDPSGSVGIGTTAPSSPLSVTPAQYSAGTASQSGQTITGSGTAWTQAMVGSQFVFSNSVSAGTITSVQSATSLTVSTSQTVASTSYVIGFTGLQVASTGNVGIGTANPTRKLHIAGDVQIDGNLYFGNNTTPQSVPFAGIQCSGGDYAESMNVTGDANGYGPGDVLVLDADNPGKVLKSAEAYSTAVAGIYSTKPGVIGRRQLGPKSDTEVPMAMVGVVPTRVTAENGAIKVGDLLVSSSIPGYAMKGTDRSRMLGAVIGKAMSSFESGTGVIEVLVTLQ